MSSWVRSAVNRAVVVGGNSNLSRTVRNYADSVVLHASNAVVGGAKIIQERIGSRNMQSFKHTVKRLEELSVSCRGLERVQLLRRWLVALKEIERLTSGCTDYNEKDPDDQLFADDSKDSPRKPTLVYYADPGMLGEPKNFRDVFLYSQALEGITLSVILDAPNEEEVSLLSEIYGLCLTGEKEERNAVLSSVQDLAKAFSTYEDEVLVKREELLQHAQGAIAGLKVNADLVRIDDEASSLKEKIEKMKAVKPDENCTKSPKEATNLAIEGLDEAAAHIQTCSRLEELLLKKKYLSHGDSPQLHVEKIDKLKVLSESLVNSTAKAESRISEHRYQKEEALNFRLTKSNEVSQVEKELAVEIEELEKQKDELEARLTKVNSSLSSARMRLHNAREEREQFDEASNEILIHLKTREDELVRSIASYRMEATVVDRWINFLQSSWILQSSYAEKREEQVNAELERYGDYFVNLVVQLLPSYKEKLGPSITQVRKLVKKLRSEFPATVDDNGSIMTNQRRKLEEEYLDVEAKFVTTLSTVDAMKKQFYIEKKGIFRKDNDKVKELFDAIEKIAEEFESIERPILEIENPTTQKSETAFASPSLTPKTPSADNQHKKREVKKSLSFTGRNPSVTVELSKIESESSEDDLLGDEIVEWEFDALDRDQNIMNSSIGK